MLTPEQFKRACGNLGGIVNKQVAISAKANLSDKNSMNALNDAGRQLNEDTLRVLVMGKFSSGKSTFLNALMGQALLPAKPMPTTAIIGEIVYAEHPEAILFPKKGYTGGEKPFNIKVEELSKYIVIDHSTPVEDKQKKPNPFKKIVIKYPLNVCKHGIMFVDSPGLDDPTCHDAITKDYLPNADAIIYCMNSNQAFSVPDKAEIERLVSLGYKSIIFVLTYFDVLLTNDDYMGTNGAEEARSHYTRELSKYTDLGANGIFFVGSLPALKAKRTGDNRLLEQSNFPPLEKRLEQILFDEKGRLKLMKALYSTRRVNRETNLHLTDLIDVANSDKNGLSERIHIAQNNLNQAQAKANEIITQFKLGSNSLVNGAKDRGRSFFLTEILPNISVWVDEFKPGEGQSISMFHPRRSGTAFTEACIKFVQKKIEAKMAEWCDKKLVQGYLYQELNRLTNQQDANLEAFEYDLKKVRTNLNLSLNSDAINESESAGKVNRILSALAAAFCLNPTGLVSGGLLGWRGLVSSLVAALIANIVVLVVSLFTPVGFSAFIITYVLASLVGGGVVLSNLESRIKKKISEKMYEELSKQQELISTNIGNAVGDILNKIHKAVEDGLNAPVLQCKKILSEAQNVVNSESVSIKNRVMTYTSLRKENLALANEMDLFAENLGA